MRIDLLVLRIHRLLHLPLRRLVHHLRAREHPRERVVIADRHRIELVIVTPRARDRHPHHRPRHRIDPVLPLVRHHLHPPPSVIFRPEPDEPPRPLLLLPPPHLVRPNLHHDDIALPQHPHSPDERPHP